MLSDMLTFFLPTLIARPERFEELPEAVADVPSMYAGLSTFIAGPRGCPAWRMAVLECKTLGSATPLSLPDDFYSLLPHRIKTLLFTLIRTFEFEAIPGLEITSKYGLVALSRS